MPPAMRSSWDKCEEAGWGVMGCYLPAETVVGKTYAIYGYGCKVLFFNEGDGTDLCAKFINLDLIPIS